MLEEKNNGLEAEKKKKAPTFLAALKAITARILDIDVKRVHAQLSSLETQILESHQKPKLT